MNRRAALIFLTCALPLARAALALYTVRSIPGRRCPTFSPAATACRVIVFGPGHLANIYTVDGEGRIAVPLIGPLRVAGGTTEAAARAHRGAPCVTASSASRR